MKQDYVTLQGITKIFGAADTEVQAVNDVNLEVAEGELVTLLGPSGCGKTTTLRMLAGFEFPTSGHMYLDGERINDVPPNARPTTMVFQNYALFPHMSVRDNITYGLRINNVAKEDIARRTDEVMRLVGLKGMGDRQPSQLSGGQQQRVSLARSLVMEPKVLLLDEPLSNLDAKLRVATRLEIRRLQQRLGITSVYVTHDQEEAMVLSDRIVIMEGGRIQQIDTPWEIYAHPANRFVADFIGRVNFLEGRVARLQDEATADEGTTGVEIELLGRTWSIESPRHKFSKGDRVLLCVRPESVQVGAPGTFDVPATVSEAVYLGSQMSYRIALAEGEVTADVPDPQLHAAWFAEGENISVTFKEQSLHVLPWEPPPEA